MYYTTPDDKSQRLCFDIPITKGAFLIRKGCATGMLCFLEEHLRETYSVDEIHLLTGTENYPAQSAYKKAGFIMKNEACMAKDVPAKR